MWECFPCGSMRCEHVAHLNNFPETIMANELKLDALERAWVKKSIDLQLQALKRSRGNEIVGSEIYVLRTKELDALAALALKF